MPRQVFSSISTPVDSKSNSKSVNKNTMASRSKLSAKEASASKRRRTRGKRTSDDFEMDLDQRPPSDSEVENAPRKGRRPSQAHMPSDSEEYEQDEVAEESAEEVMDEDSLRSQLADNPEYDPEQDTTERRDIRKQYRQLISEVEELQQQLQANTGDREQLMAVLIQKSDEAQKIFKRVKNTNEATLDSKLLLLTANLGLEHAQKMQGQLRQFDVQELIQRLQSYMAGDDVNRDDDLDDIDFDWRKLGHLALKHMTTVPSLQFMLGPLKVERKTRKVQRTARLNKDVKDLREAEELSAEDIQKSENETTRNIRLVFERLSELGPTVLWRFVINPTSFSQSVENVFYCAFLAKDGRVAIQEAEDGSKEVIIQAIEQASEEERALKERFQHMLSLDYGAWQYLVEMYDIRDSCIPTRVPVNTKMTKGKWYG